MAKISINLLGWNHKAIIGKAIRAVLKQTYRDFVLFYSDNASQDGSLEYVRTNFPDVKIIEHRTNHGYAGGHNLFFAETKSEFAMVLNPDAILEANFLSVAVVAFNDPSVASVTGKMLKPNSEILDGTGLVLSRSRRARERGQNEKDLGQYDGKTDIFGVSGTAAIYRKSALDGVQVPKLSGGFEYFDEDFFAYFEDLDLAWRLRLAGYKAKYEPRAIVNHGRQAGSSPGGFLRFKSFYEHRKTLPQKVKNWSYKNHLFAIVKNDSGWNFLRDLPFILIRELAMFFYILIFETRTLKVCGQILRDFSKMLKKRRYIMQNIKV